MFPEVLKDGTVLEHSIYGDENSMSHCNDGPLAATAPCETVIQAREVAASDSGGGPRRFDQGRAKPWIAVARPAALVLPGAFIVPRAHLGPRSQMMCIRKTRDDVGAYLDENLLGPALADTMNRIELVGNVLVRSHAL